MQRRVRLVVGLLLLVTIASLAVPLALTVGDRRATRLFSERDRHLVSLAEHVAGGDLVLRRASWAERYIEVYDEPVIVVDVDGQPVDGGGLDVDDPGVAEAIRLGLAGEPAPAPRRIWPWTTERPFRSAAAYSGDAITALAVTRIDTSVAARDVANVWLIIVVGMGGLVLTAMVLTRWLSRWAMRPIHSLELAARSLAHGDRSGEVLQSGPPELRELVEEFNRMVLAVQSSLDAQRQLVADASHQLRNPLAAVLLRADSLGAHVADSGRRTHQGLLDELDRIHSLLQRLLSLARAQEVAAASRVGKLAPTRAVAVPLSEVVAERLQAWAPAAQTNQQSLTVVGDLPESSVPDEDVGQVLDIFIDNAINYAGAWGDDRDGGSGPRRRTGADRGR